MTKHQQSIQYKKYITLLETSFLSVLNAIREFILNNINTISEESWILAIFLSLCRPQILSKM